MNEIWYVAVMDANGDDLAAFGPFANKDIAVMWLNERRANFPDLYFAIDRLDSPNEWTNPNILPFGLGKYV